MTRILIRKGRIVDPVNQRDETLDLLIEDGKISAVDRQIEVPADETLFIPGKIVAPGFIDIHAHLREPGYEEKETLATGTRAAAAGGYTAVACMANTNPANDQAAVTRWLLEKAKQTAVVRVWPIAAITRGLKGEQMVEMADLREEGAVAFSDDGEPVENDELMRAALEYSLMLDCPIINHCQVRSLSREGVMHEGAVSTRLGLRGIPAEAESIMVARDIALARLTGAHVHIAHLSTRQAVDLLRLAHHEGLHVTAEVTPHHLTLTADAIEASHYDTNFKVNPPLRETEDIEALVQAIKEGLIQAIATDHAPHEEDAKRVEFNLAAFGMIGFETAVAATLECLIHGGHLSWLEYVRLFTTGPAEILHIRPPRIAPGEEAHITIIDPEREWVYSVDQTFSKSKNSPFHGRKFRGKVVGTLVMGRFVFRDNQSIQSE